MEASAAVEYFEFADLLPGVRHFHCDRLRANLSVSACAANWTATNEQREGARDACKRCSLGAVHAGHTDVNLHPLRGTKTCARCHKLSRRLINKHLCVSCANRQYEALKGVNRKGTAPERLTAAMLQRRSVSYMAGGELKTRTIKHAVDQDEVIVAVLRDEPKAVTFAFQPPASARVMAVPMDCGVD